MKAKYGAIVVAGSGKINGFVASRNRAGAYFRTKVTPVNPSSSAQNNVRSRLTNLSQAWRGLTDDQRSAWNAAVANFARTDIFGDIKNPTGFNLYQRLNNELAQCGIPSIDNPPVPQGVETVLLSTVAMDVSDGDLDIALDGNVPASSSMKIWATPGMSPGISFVKSEYRLIAVVGGGEVSPLEQGAAWIAKFGTMIEGQKVFVAVEFVNETTGEVSQRQSLSCIIAA